MTFQRFQGFSLVGVIALSLALAAGTTGCPKKPKATPTPTPAATPEGGDVGGDGTGATDTGMTGSEAGCDMAPVVFALDSASLDGSATDALRQAATCLQNNPTWTVVIEGHADERGSTTYNVALGERRARSVLDYLANAGVAGNRLQVVSFGEEKPADPGHDEAAWAKNRRVEFRVKKSATSSR